MCMILAAVRQDPSQPWYRVRICHFRRPQALCCLGSPDAHDQLVLFQ